jgi:hypothetical protein
MSDKAVVELLDDIEEGYPDIFQKWIEGRATE